METNDFEKFVASTSEHEQEIKRTRVGGLGGSDASILYRVGLNGMSALTNTDQKRLAVMMGLAEPQDFGGNVYTRAGHQFEDAYAEGVEIAAKEANGEYQREYVMEQPLAKNFKTFAHADFALNNFMNPDVVECKYVQDTTAATLAKYMPQLQWYYVLGANTVILAHGWGSVEPFEVEDAEIVTVERDEQYTKALLQGIKTLDKAISDGWRPVVTDKANVEAAPEVVQSAFANLATAKQMAADAKAMEDEAKKVLQEYMTEFRLNGITNEVTGKQVVFVGEKTTERFDLDKFKKELLTMADGDAGKLFTYEQVLDLIEQSKKTSVTKASVQYR